MRHGLRLIAIIAGERFSVDTVVSAKVRQQPRVAEVARLQALCKVARLQVVRLRWLRGKEFGMDKFRQSVCNAACRRKWTSGVVCAHELHLWMRERIPVSLYVTALARGAAHQQAGEFQQAERLYRQILRGDPQHAAAWHQLGLVQQLKGQCERAAESIGRAVFLDSSEPVFQLDLGRVCAALGRLDEAVEYLQQAIVLAPENSQAHYHLGTVLKQCGDMIGAKLRFQQSVRLDPECAAAWNDLGIAHQACAELDEAASAFERLARVAPTLGRAQFNLGNVRLAQGRLLEAVACYARALERQPSFAAALNNLGTALHRLGRPMQALHACEMALKLSPDFVEARINLGNLLNLQGRVDEAADNYRQALEFNPSPRLHVEAATMLPPIYESIADLYRRRTQFENQLADLEQQRVHLDHAREPIPVTPLLAYQGFNDRELARRLATLCRTGNAADGSASAGPSELPPPHFAVRRIASMTALESTGKLRVGFLSRFLRDHTIGELTKGLISKLTRSDFEVFVFLIGDAEDETVACLRKSADQFINLPEDVAAANEQVAAAGLDVLVFPDVGLDPVATALAHSRLARVQCSMWGHPVTTGIPTIDHFLSSKLFEPSDAAEHYAENLVQFESLTVYFERPAVDDAQSRDAARREFGLPRHEHLYLCPHPLFQLHPEFDDLLRAILDRDAAGRIVLIAAPYKYWNEKLFARLRRHLGALTDRVIFTGPVERQALLRLISTADVVLDPPCFGSIDMSLKALGLGLPIVTLPARFLRGRFTAGCYRKMQFENFVARSPQEYVDLAVRLGTDAVLNAAVRAVIAARSGLLFEDIAAVRELERFFQQVARPVKPDTVRPRQPVAA
jgi:predicted O-linked N-acetylglucosamine transferase (SPINDLY family)